MGHVGQGLSTEFLNGTRDFVPTPGLGSSFLILDSSATVVIINSGLSSYDVVYLKPGSDYEFATDEQIVIPAGKQLIGLASDGVSDNTPKVIFDYAIAMTGDAIVMGSNSSIKNLELQFTGVAPVETYAITNDLQEDVIVVESLKMTGWTSGSGAAVSLTYGRVSNCYLDVGARAVYVRRKDALSSLNPYTVISNCYLNGSALDTPAVELEDGVAGGHNIVIKENTISVANSHGILRSGSDIFVGVIIKNNIIVGNPNGFNGIEGFAGAEAGVRISDNYIRDFTGAGATHNLGIATGTNRAAYHGNIGSNNGTDNPALPASWRDFNNNGST